MALEVFSGTVVTIPAPHTPGAVAFTSNNADTSPANNIGTFTTVNIGGSGANIPEVGIIFPHGVPIFCG